MADESDWRNYLKGFDDADMYVPVEETDWHDNHEGLYENIPELLNRVPADFDSDVHMEGLDATDIFGLNEILASSVENQVVESLNTLKPDLLADNYANYEFIRQSQTFPDVLFRDASDPSTEPTMGIELKCWYLLAKEGEPSFRYKTTAAACAPQDLLVIYPWTLDNIVTGEPEIYRPFIMPAKFASLFIDHYWQNLKDWQANDPDKGIDRPEKVSHYPDNTDNIQDDPHQDKGNNYGRFRSKIIDNLPPMNEYVNQMRQRELLGIPAERWTRFFESADEDDEPIELSDLTGVGPGTAETMRDVGIMSPRNLKSLLRGVIEDKVSGVGPTTAEDIIDDLAKVRED